MQTAITRESGAALAIGLTSVLYAAFHFVSGKYHVAPEDVGFSGLHMLGVVLKDSRNPRSLSIRSCASRRWEYCWASCAHLTGNIAACIDCMPGG